MHGGWSQLVSGYCCGSQQEGGVCREPGVWDMAEEVLCSASGLGKHWDGWEISSTEVVCGRRAQGCGGLRLWKCCATERMGNVM